MYHEEKLINGILHRRGSPDEYFVPYTLADLSARYRSVLAQINELEAKVAELENER